MPRAALIASKVGPSIADVKLFWHFRRGAGTKRPNHRIGSITFEFLDPAESTVSLVVEFGSFDSKLSSYMDSGTADGEDEKAFC